MDLHKRILLVDDEERVLFVIRNSLKKLGDGYEIVTARDGREALDRVGEAFFDLVITDLKMPGMDGVKLTEAIRTQSPATLVIWMTAYGNQALEAKAHRLGVHRFLAKPLGVADIRQIAREALETTIRRQESDPPSPSRADGLLQERLYQLQEETGARAVLLTTTGGWPVDMVGATEELDVPALSALVAGNFVAAHEIARLLGRDSTFKLSHHESDKDNIYAYGVGKDYLMVIVFGHETKTGVVWFYARRAASELAEILAEMPVEDQPEEILDADFAQDLHSELDGLFEEFLAPPPQEPATLPAEADQPSAANIYGKEPGSPAPLLSLEEAITRGLVQSNIV